jgi:hypothetical protein
MDNKSGVYHPITLDCYMLVYVDITLLNYYIMKLQDYYPFDSAIVGLENIYCTVGEDAFFVNSSCILADDKYIKKGETYLLFGSKLECGNDLSWVILLDAFFQYGYINLIVLDKYTQEARTIYHSISTEEYECSWRLIDTSYFINVVMDEYRNKK